MQCFPLTEASSLREGIIKRDNVEALKNVIEDEPHFFTKIIDNDLRALTMITKHFMSEHEKGIIESQRRKLWWQRWKRWFHGGKRRWLVSQMLDCDVGGVEKISSSGSKFMANAEDCLDGCDGAGGGEVKGGGVDLGVVNSLLGEIPGDVMGEKGRDTIGVDGGAVW
ncbi:hypothetical protein Tco_1447262 [Tanacetum coccineum]